MSSGYNGSSPITLYIQIRKKGLHVFPWQTGNRKINHNVRIYRISHVMGHKLSHMVQPFVMHVYNWHVVPVYVNSPMPCGLIILMNNTLMWRKYIHHPVFTEVPHAGWYHVYKPCRTFTPHITTQYQQYLYYTPAAYLVYRMEAFIGKWQTTDVSNADILLAAMSKLRRCSKCQQCTWIMVTK